MITEWNIENLSRLILQCFPTSNSSSLFNPCSKSMSENKASTECKQNATCKGATEKVMDWTAGVYFFILTFSDQCRLGVHTFSSGDGISFESVVL